MKPGELLGTEGLRCAGLLFQDSNGFNDIIFCAPFLPGFRKLQYATGKMIQTIAGIVYVLWLVTSSYGIGALITIFG